MSGVMPGGGAGRLSCQGAREGDAATRSGAPRVGGSSVRNAVVAWPARRRLDVRQASEEQKVRRDAADLGLGEDGGEPVSATAACT